MINYAFINSENIVVGLLIGPENGLESFYESLDIFDGLTCRQVENVVQDTHDGTFVSVGYTYESSNNTFVAPPIPEFVKP
jgi:hypothetical protein